MIQMRRRRYTGLVGAIVQLVMVLTLVLAPAVAWVWNVVELVSCDWGNGKSWKGEIVHSIGLIPYASLVTVWFSDK